MLKLKIYGSSSKGNCYELITSNSSLLLDCGKEVEIDVNKNIKGIVASHLHNDHIGGIPKIKDYYKGNYYANREVLDVLPIIDTNKVEIVENEPFKIENFNIYPFKVEHDVETYNYLIRDTISNMKILYMTDLANMNDFQFKDVDIMLVECNYNEDIVDYEDFKTQRLVRTHTSLQECGEFLINNINICTKYVFLIHITRSIEDYKYYEEYIKEKINNPNIQVIAVNPHLKEPIEYNLQEEIDISFD